MDKNKESVAFKKIMDIIRNSCDLTSYECYYLRGCLSYQAEKIAEAEYHAEAARKNELNRKQNYNPNITMISCGSK